MKSITVPLNEETVFDGVATIECPYGCGEPRRVEPDANYTVTCEGCGKQYKIYPCC